MRFISSISVGAFLTSTLLTSNIYAAKMEETKLGQILLYSTKDGSFIDKATVGNLPDMVKFSSDGKTLVVANEGEPSDDYKNDPKGSISIISLDENKKVKEVTTLGFDDVKIKGDVRVKPNTEISRDLEPEYVAINESNTKAWVSLQENNALAIVDLVSKNIEEVVSLGRVDLSTQDMDIVADKKAKPAKSAKNIYALYQPDTIVSYSVAGKDYIVMANEGDDREYDSWEDYEKLKKLKAELSDEFKPLLETKMSSLRVLKDMGKNKDGFYDELYLAGTRSFSIRDAKGNLVFDSKDEFEKLIAKDYAKYFNTRVDDIKLDDEDFAQDMQGKVEGKDYEIIGNKAYFFEGIDARSLKKGVEPEALAIANIDGRFYAYIGLEKQGGFFVYDITNPKKPFMVEYNNDINYEALPSKAGDLAPEGMVTFKQDDKNYLAIANELSSTISLYELSTNGKAKKLNSLKVGSFDEGAAEILDYCKSQKRVFVTNGEDKKVDIIDVSNPLKISKVGSVDFSKYSDSLQSVSVKNGVLAIAVE